MDGFSSFVNCSLGLRINSLIKQVDLFPLPMEQYWTEDLPKQEVRQDFIEFTSGKNVHDWTAPKGGS